MFFILLFNSCQKKEEAYPGYSAAFKPVLDTVTVLFATNRLDKGLLYLDSAMNQISGSTIDDRFRAYAFHYIYSLKEKGDNKEALRFADSMLILAEQDVNDPQYASNFAEANFAMGDAYFNMQRYNEAYQHFFNGYAVAKNSLDKNALADYNYRMAMIMYKMGDFKFAARYFIKSYELHTPTRDKFADFYAKQEILDNIALSYKHSNKPDSAIVYFDKALEYIKHNGPQFTDRLKMIDVATGVVDGNKGDVLYLQGKYQAAEELWKKSIAINLRKTYDNQDAELTEIKLAQLYYDENKDSDLFNLLNAINLQLGSIKNQDVMVDWNRLMSKYYIRKKELPTALGYLQTYNTLKDSITEKVNLLRESDVIKQLDTYQKEQQIEDLSSRNKFQKIYMFVFTILAVMAVIIISLVYRNWKRSKKDVQKVNFLNRQINEQNIVLENALNELKNNSREKDRILRAVAHDLRNPLGGIASLTAIMAEEDFTDEQKEQINMVKDTSFNALELINEILEATNSSAVQLNLEWVDINLLVNHSVELLRFKAAEKGQRILLEPLSTQTELYISREKIWRVVSNLISNAIKFSPTGSTISIKVLHQPGEVLVAVEDNGIGIPDKMRDQVFNMFTTAQRPGTAGEKSFGLGLSICRQIMDKFHGRIWFESKEKGGTIFYISLPLTDSDVEAELAQKFGVPVS